MNFIHGFHGNLLQHFSHQVMGISCSSSSSPRALSAVDSDLDLPSSPGRKTVVVLESVLLASASSRPCRRSISTPPSTPVCLHWRTHPGTKLSSGLPGFFHEIFPQYRIPAFRRRHRQPPDFSWVLTLFFSLSLLLPPPASLVKTPTHPGPRTLRAQHSLLELLTFLFRLRNPPYPASFPFSTFNSFPSIITTTG